MRTLLLALSLFFCYAFASAQIIIEEGDGSYYNDKLAGNATASGEAYNPKIFTAAHQSLPFGTKVVVTNKNNGKSVIVRINDRGPFVEGRIIDLSRAAAQQIDMIVAGTVPVKIRTIDGNSVLNSQPTPVEVPTSTPTTEVITTTDIPASQPAPELPEVITSTPSTTSTSPSMPTPVINSKTITGNYAVQLGSFRNFENVGIELAKFTTKSFSDELKIYETWKDGQKLYKILVGPFQSREAAAGRMANIKSTYNLDCFIFTVR